MRLPKLTRKAVIIIIGILLLISAVVVIPVLFAQHELFTNDESAVAEDAGTVPDLAPNGSTIIALFHADWCPHCVEFRPIFADVADKYGGDGNMKFVEVDCVAHADIAKEYGVDGFPTVKIITDDGTDDYEGERTAEEFAKFVKKLKQ